VSARLQVVEHIRREVAVVLDDQYAHDASIGEPRPLSPGRLTFP
jgi:hypothetical protein